MTMVGTEEVVEDLPAWRTARKSHSSKKNHNERLTER